MINDSESSSFWQNCKLFYPMLGFISNEQPDDQKLYHVRKKDEEEEAENNLNIMETFLIMFTSKSSSYRPSTKLCVRIFFSSLVDYRRILSEAPGRMNLLVHESYG